MWSEEVCSLTDDTKGNVERIACPQKEMHSSSFIAHEISIDPERKEWPGSSDRPIFHNKGRVDR